jgi:hypothetical protein
VNTDPDRARRLLEEEGRFTILASGVSMHPLIRDRDVLTVTSLRADRLRIGHAVLHENEGRLLVHCVVKIDRNNAGLSTVVQLRGTCGSGPTYRVDAGEILGLVVSIRRGGRYVPATGLLRRALAAACVRVLPAMRRK